MRRTYAYIKQADGSVKLRDALDSLVVGEERIRLENRAKVKDISLILGIITVSSIFMIEIRLDNFSLVNINPHFFMGIILLFALHKMTKYVGKSTAPKIALWIFIIISAFEWVMEANFLSEYSFSLLASSGLVKGEFEPILIVSLVEVVCFAVAVILFGRGILKLQALHSAQGDDSGKKRLFTVGYIALSVILGAMRYASLLLRYFAKNTTVSFENDGMITNGVVTEPLLPWFGVVVIAVTIIYVFYSYYLFVSIKEDVQIKYS